jgi:hypothetical protein
MNAKRHCEHWRSRLAKRPEAGLGPPASEDGSALADWAEAVMLLEEAPRLSRATLRSRASEVGPADEMQLDLLYAEIGRRRSIAPRSYPFQVDATGVVRRRVDKRLYELLLLLSLEQAPYRERGAWVRASRILELVGAAALAAYWGPRAQAVQFGWPSIDGRPKNFSAAITWLAEVLELPEGGEDRSSAKKDGGVDLVAWVPFEDHKGSFSAVLAQVTVGLGDLAEKSLGIPLHQWNNVWIGFGVPPLTALVCPFALSMSAEVWSDLRFRASIVLERMRICGLITSQDIDAVLRAGWVDQFIKNERAALLLS